MIRFVTRARRGGHVVTVEVPRTPGGPPDGESALRRVHNLDFQSAVHLLRWRR
jgi:hypothetical protein